jgi:hypothetical protein
VSFAHVDPEHTAADDVLPQRWTMIESVLYAVSILTTTG